MKKSLILIIMMVATIAVFAQQDAMFTHYMFNTQHVNPAYAGSRDALTVTGLHRSQWVSFPGAPTTQTITMHTPLANDKIGIGLSVVNDKIGPTKNTSGYADVAYRLPVSEKATLSFGLKAGINVLRAGLTELQTQDQGDEEFQTDLTSTIQPNFGVGLYYHTEKFYAGLSAPGLLSNNFENDNGSTLTTYDQQKHFFMILGSVFDLSENIKLKPTGLLKVTDAAPIEADLTGTLLFNEKYWAGLMFRTQDAVGALLGMQITEQLAAGYSFDWSFNNETFQYNNGSHELMLRYDFIFNEEGKIRSPRYF